MSSTATFDRAQSLHRKVLRNSLSHNAMTAIFMQRTKGECVFRSVRTNDTDMYARALLHKGSTLVGVYNTSCTETYLIEDLEYMVGGGK